VWLVAVVPRNSLPYLLTGCLCLGACSVDAPLPSLPNDTAEAWSHRPDTTGADHHPDLADWWRAFDDPTLDRLIETALKDNLGIQIAAERLTAARSLHHRSRSDFWPNINFRIYPETAPGAETGYLEIGFDASWEFGFFGRSQANSRMRAADLNTTVIDAAAANVSVSAEVSRSYVELRAAQARKAALSDIVRVRQRQVELGELRLQARMGSRLDVGHAQEELQATLSEASEPETTTVEAQEALSVLLGHNRIDPDLDQEGKQPHLAPVEIRQAPADLLRTRPEIRHAEQNILRAAGELGIAHADLYPKLGIVGTLISSTALTGDIEKPNKAVPLLAPTFTLPILDWGARRDVVNAREAALAAAVLAYREAVLESVAEVETALARFNARQAAVMNSEESLKVAQQILDTVRASRQIGLSDDIDLAGAELARCQAQLQHIQSVRDLALSYIALYKAFGGNVPPLAVPAS
jgi:outer membrane protein, multidrug efflux system